MRALLALMTCGLYWVLVLLPEEKAVPIPLFLYFLLSLILVFFVAHGSTIGRAAGSGRSPCHLPKGTFRVLIVVGTAAAVGWAYYAHRDELIKRLTPQPDQLDQWPFLLLSLAGGFFAGHLLGAGPWRRTAMFQDGLATVSLLCMFGLVIDTLVILFINPSVETKLRLHVLEYCLTAAIALYFGARS